MRKILVTAISGDIGNGVLKILKDTGDELYGCDVNRIAVGMDLVKVFWQSSYAVSENYIGELAEKCSEYGITHLIPVNEREIEVIDRNRKPFEERGIRLVMQSNRVLGTCLDKYLTAEELRKNGLPAPETFIRHADLPDPEAVYIVKPRRSNGSKHIMKGKGSELSDEFDGDYVYQAYIDSDDEYTVGVFRDGDVLNTIAFRRQLKNGYSNLVELVHDEELDRIAAECARLFDLTGYINIQLRKKDGRYFIFEINPRISGTVRFRSMLGFNDVLWWLDLLDGKHTEPYTCPYRTAVGIRELNEKMLIKE